MTKPDIVQVFRRYYPEVDVKGKGGWEKIHCPEHAESNPSASVSSFKSRWSCFVCDISEDGYDVIMRKEGIGFRAAQEFATLHFAGGHSPELQPELPRKPSRGVHQAPRFGQHRNEDGPRLRRAPRYGS